DFGHRSYVGTVEFSPDGKFLASASEEEVKIWAIPSGELVRTIAEAAQIATWRSDGSAIAAMPRGGTGVGEWAVATGEASPMPWRTPWRIAGSRLAESTGSSSSGIPRPRGW